MDPLSLVGGVQFPLVFWARNRMSGVENGRYF
jgi:hypothetical protein